MFIRSSFRILKPIVGYRSITQTTATLRVSKDVTQQIACTVGGAPDYTVIIPKHVGNTLAGQDLGSVSAKKNLMFYDGRHFALGTIAMSREGVFSPANLANYVMIQDKNPLSPRLTLTEEVAPLISRFSGGSEIPAVLYNCGELDGSGIALKGTEGGEIYLSVKIQGPVSAY